MVYCIIGLEMLVKFNCNIIFNLKSKINFRL